MKAFFLAAGLLCTFFCEAQKDYEFTDTRKKTESFKKIAQKDILDYDEKYLIKIDRKTYYGGFGFMPKTSVSQIILTIGKDTIVIPPAAYSDLHNLNLTYNDKGTQRTANGIYRSKDGHKLYL